MVKEIKRCLRKTLGTAFLSFDELSTVLVEVEHILNSRPLIYYSDEDLDEPLTPSHLFHGRRILSLPDVPISNLVELKVSNSVITRRMEYLSTLLSRYWNQWRRYYLFDLCERHKLTWKKMGGTFEISVGDVVIVYEEKQPRSNWLLGKMERIIRGKDGHIRGALLRVITREKDVIQ